MYGAGHVMDMINRIKQNRAQRPSKRPKFKEHFREGIHSTSSPTQHPSYKTVSPSELRHIKQQIREVAQSEKRKEQKRIGTFLIMALLAFIGLLIWLNG